MLPLSSFLENRAVYEITWKNIVEAERPNLTVWGMRIAVWIPKATNTQSEYVLLIAFRLQQWLNERALLLLFTYIVLLLLVLDHFC
jgi:hypothetical protein